MGYRCFEVEEAGGVAHLRMCRPEELNTLVEEFWSELPEIVEGFDAQGNVRAVVVSSTGRHFTAGLDLGVLASGTVDRDAEIGRARANLRMLTLALQETFSSLERARMPVLAAVQGGCVGGGLDFITACDMRYCTADAFFCVQEINIGITADVGTLQRLPKIIPEGIAREMAYTGRRLSAQRALEVGLVNAVYDDHEAMLTDVLAMAREIAERSPLAMWGSKEMLNYVRDHSVADGLNLIATWQSGMFQPGEVMEAMSAKQEKRAPSFPDLLPKPKGL
ncbi:MAG: crotonase/enoyl-CoA hydratase family protein [Deltaproteobacteria bacterium]|jgi:enoyl-CoA hydratase|nr:crotonase/enoyl-CoA hydratase family protein [Deltaproteobacteria bacterium]MBW2382029.1 crotonase/enoyl-CoA hydratase family protein [Deltaproteobacteria bacterium]